ncbi:hypothetical protein WJX77_003824 [Trebouxia sp. C0004]
MSYPYRAVTVLCLVFSVLPFSHGVTEGDEEFDTQTLGNFYVFADQVIHIINPSNLSVIGNITRDNLGAPLTNNGSLGGDSNTSRTWNDAVLVENPSLGTRHVFVNEGDVYQSSNGSQYSYVSVIDTVSQKIVARPQVGATPVHIYYVNETSSAWSHSDGQGSFFVLTPESATNVTLAAVVPSYVSSQMHGKLIVNGAINPSSYGSNVGEQVLEKFNLTTNTRTNHFNFSSFLPDPSVCVGTHTIVYSQVNQHIYVECVDGAGTIEWNTLNDTFVTLQPYVGTLYNAPAGDLIFVTNTDNSTSAALHPGVNGNASYLYQYIEIGYQPSDPVLYSNATSSLPAGAGNYSAFFPTVRNTNINNIAQAAAAGGSVTEYGYYGQNTADDNSTPVECKYNSTSATGTTGLQLLNGSNGEPATPDCGACAAGITPLDPTQYNASLAGLGVIALSNLSGNASTANATLVSAGAAAPQLSLASNANECSFAQVARGAVRGGPFIAVTADLPQSSVYIVDAAAPGTPLYGQGYVLTADSPVTVTWVPYEEGTAAAPSPAVAMG